MYFNKKKLFVFYGGLILKYVICKIYEIINNVLERNDYIGNYICMYI